MHGRTIAAAKCGVYAMFDYDGEPIYVGQTYERLGGRVRRHLTNQRTDAVGMHVLDPMEVAEIELWPFWDLENAAGAERTLRLNQAEYTVYRRLADAAEVSELLNEAVPSETELIELPSSIRRRIVPDDVYDRLRHKDERIARRAATIALLAQVVRERDVSIGLRKTLVTQAQRLERLAKSRFDELVAESPPQQVEAETERLGEEPDHP